MSLSEWRPEYSILGGMLVGRDGRVHSTLGHNPSSLRLCSFDPNLQNIPNGKKGSVAGWVKECFVAPPGHTFVERDFSAIEAVLVGYFAKSRRYIEEAKLGIHDSLASVLLGDPVPTDATVEFKKARYKVIKADHKPVRDTAKRCIHGSNYLMTPNKMHIEYPETFTNIKAAREVQEAYFALYPEIRGWHKELTREVDGTKRRKGEEGLEVTPWTLGVAYAQNPFGYVHRFFNVLDWRLIEGKWYAEYGDDAKRLVSFLPQSTAAAIIKKAARTIWYDYPRIGAMMRMLIHDSILFECRDEDVEECLAISAEVMERVIEELPLPEEWGMGPYLSIGTEAKVGKVWGEMN